MAQVTKTAWTTALGTTIYVNGVKAINATDHSSLLTNLKDSVLWKDGTLTTNGVPYLSSDSTLAYDAALTWDATNNALTIGVSGCRMHTTGSASTNIFIGNAAGNFTLTGTSNVGIGGSTLVALTSGTLNTVVGRDALDALTTGSRNTAVGNNALGSVQTSDGNTAIGQAALNIATGANNTGLGYGAGDNITSGANNVIIGALLDAQSATTSDQLSIQNIIFGTGNSATGTTISTGMIGIGVATSLGARLHVKAENNTLALLLEDDAGNDIFAAGESGGARVVGFYGVTPVSRQTTTSQTPATFVTNTSLIADDSATWDGYTIGDIVAILRAYGLLT